jgi:hypothetical protein
MADGRNILESVGPASRAEWLACCEQDDRATFFHTPYWSELFERGYVNRYRAEPRLIRFCDATAAVVPMVVNRHWGGMFRTTCSMPGGTFGGVLFRGDLSPEKEAAVMAQFDNHASLLLRENPYRPFTILPSNCRCIDEHTRTVDLTPGYEPVWKRATAAHRNAVRNAVRSGVEVCEAENADDWDTYVAVYHESIGRWKQRRIFSGASYPAGFFGQIEQLPPSLRTLYLAKVKGRCIAGILCFYWGQRAVVWHGAGRAGDFSLHPNNLLYDRAIARSVERGCAWFDCNPSGGLEGVDKFKQYLGAQRLPGRLFIRRSPLIRIADRLRGWRSGT